MELKNIKRHSAIKGAIMISAECVRSLGVAIDAAGPFAPSHSKTKAPPKRGQAREVLHFGPRLYSS